MPLKRLGNTVRAYHYSKVDDPLRSLSGLAHGTGARGQEAGRLAGAPGRARSYFYLEGSRPQEGRLTPRPESGVGAGATYRGKLTGMYDLQENPLGLTERGNALERRLQELGYNGYYDPQTGIAVNLRHDTEVARVGDYRAQAEEALLRAQQLPDRPYYVTAENIPSRTTPMGSWLLQAENRQPRGLLDRYTDEVENIFEKSGLMRDLDIPTYATTQGYGAYEKSIRPNIVTAVPSREEAKRLADARGYLTQQDAVPFFSRAGEAGPRGVLVTTQDPIDAIDRQQIYGNLGLDFTRSDLDALDFINYADETGPFSGMDDDQFARVIDDYFARRGDATSVQRYRADSEYNPTGDSWVQADDGTSPGQGQKLGELRKRLESYNREFQRQHGRADPRVLALLAASTGAGALAAPAFVGTGGSSAGDIYDAALAAVTSGAQELYGAGADFIGALAGRAPPEERAPGFTPANPDNPILSGAERMLQGALSYTPPLSGRPLGEELGTIVDTFQGAGENIRNAFGERLGNVMTTGANLGFNVLDFLLPGSVVLPGRFRKMSTLKKHVPESESDIVRSFAADSRLKKGGGGVPSENVLTAVENRSRYRREPDVLPRSAGDMSEYEWERFGDQYDVNMSRTPSQSLGISDPRTKREIMVPGGLEGEFTIPDLFQIKADNFDPGLLDRETHNALMNKFIRTYRRPGGSDEVDIFNDLNFALLSPNAPLTPNEFLAQRLRIANMDELGALAERRGTAGLGGMIDAETGVGAASRGGMGIKGTAALENQSDLAGLLMERPDVFRPAGDETLRDVGFRVMNQVPGLSVKTASLGVPWTDLDRANTSAVDLWMIRKNYERLARENPEFAKRLQTLVDKGQTPEDAAISIIGGGHPSLIYRKKSGELNEAVPEYLQPGRLAYEPEKFTTPNQFYQQIMSYVDESRGPNPDIELFPEQWRLWDTYRGRVEPHEFAHPDWRRLPRQSFNEMQAALAEHKRLGYMKAPEPGQPPLPTKPGDWRRLYYGRVDPSLLPWLGLAAGAGYLTSGQTSGE